ncbi:hypothetical protein BO85DRAFT_270826 [Aspergillus piperis CBS 112811]|uniref:Uncharacterized protein n=2 Tax=Aspergillus subgen. Circumdati TaxID=2720871 RepID=A0A1L9NCT4_ASPTC|nr:hypothetical protein BO85DRAFT_270826 [Aspergillus piperis CBS 112811]OJI86992.1 hypothetical protein ASPTUDRAFT_508314 [Aspergillus tubingensis CBS 134.48]RAH58275.1 hypothetical protein BO85DRAFT_270826 [Aspergillus piperis CBS 112811]
MVRLGYFHCGSRGYGPVSLRYQKKHSGSPFVIVIVFPSLIFFVAHHLAYWVWG